MRALHQSASNGAPSGIVAASIAIARSTWMDEWPSNATAERPLKNNCGRRGWVRRNRQAERVDLSGICPESRAASAISSMKVHWTWSSAQLVRSPAPLPASHAVENRLATDDLRPGTLDCRLTTYDDDTSCLFAFCFHVILVAVDAG